MKNKIKETEKGYVIEINSEDVEKAKEIIALNLDDAGISSIDGLTAMIMSAIEIAAFHNLSKPNFLAKVSGYWEQVLEVLENEPP